MGVAHGASFPGKQTLTRKPGSPRGGQVEGANPPRREWGTTQWRAAGGGARKPVAEQGLEAGCCGGLRVPGRRLQCREAARGRRGRAKGLGKSQLGKGRWGSEPWAGFRGTIAQPFWASVSPFLR